jgi:hypothetical protein
MKIRENRKTTKESDNLVPERAVSQHKENKENRTRVHAHAMQIIGYRVAISFANCLLRKEINM